jgi:hypothetical protein
MRGWWLVGLCACRIGFDARPTDADVDLDTSDAAITTITFGERPTSQRTNVTRDAYIDEQTSFNYGGTEDLSVAEFAGNVQHSLIRFDVSSIAPGTTVVGARLLLVRLDYGDETPGTLEVRLLGESWVEGTNNGSPGPGVTWMSRDGTTAWTTPGGTTTRSLGTLAPDGDDVIATIDPAVVQQWVDAQATNHGLLLTVVGNTPHYHMHSRSSDLISAARPELAIDVLQ